MISLALLLFFVLVIIADHRKANSPRGAPVVMASEIRSVLEDLRRPKGYAKHPVAQSVLSDQIRDYEAKVFPFSSTHR
jgi:hypothetical protein